MKKCSELSIGWQGCRARLPCGRCVFWQELQKTPFRYTCGKYSSKITTFSPDCNNCPIKFLCWTSDKNWVELYELIHR